MSRLAQGSAFATYPPVNRLLATLPQYDYERLLPQLSVQLLSHGDVLANAGAAVQHVYFPLSGIISHVLTSDEGTDIEVGLHGIEGMSGIEAIFPTGQMLYRATVQVPGRALRLTAEFFREEFKRGSALQQVALQHLQLASVQSSQCALCNRLHSVEERLSRWLLMIHDRVQGDQLELTQEFIADMLGTRRSGVTIACGTLKSAGLIRYTRGCITVLDREGLEETACECYTVIHQHSKRLLP
jgi:CRP-like cAMP-binding protein